MLNEEYLLVNAAALPDVFLRVLEAKELLASGRAGSVSQAVKQADVSRSAYYKYKDHIFRTGQGQQTVTLAATLRDETGALQTLLAALSAAGAGVVTISQSPPQDGTAKVAVTVRTDEMKTDVNGLVKTLQKQPMLVSIRIN